MKKSIIFFCAAFFITLFSAACNPQEPNGNENDNVAVISISLDINSLILTIGENYTFTAIVLPVDATNKSITWSSNNDFVASVINGVLTANTVGTTIITAQAGNETVICEVSVYDPLTYDKGVVINGVKWATRNVAAFGTFVENPEGVGMFYQWNRPFAWSATGNVTGWNNITPEGTTWEIVNDPCPEGWRIPTSGELNDLIGSDIRTWTTENGINGRFFGNGSNTIFLPAAGYRNYDNGTLRDVGAEGNYWSSTEFNINYYAYCLDFCSGCMNVNGGGKTSGFSVRCVAE